MYSSITWLNLSKVTWFLYNKITSTKCISSHMIFYKQMLHTIPLVIRDINTITDKEIKWCILNLFSITVSHFIDYMRMTSHTWRMHAYIVRVEKRLRSRNIFLDHWKQIIDLSHVPDLIQPPRYNWNIVESGVKHHKSKFDSI